MGVGTDDLHVLRLRAMSAALVVELQRADTKASALCAAAGGLLTAGIAALSVAGIAWPADAALLSASLSLAAALGAGLWALRPVLPRCGASGELLALRRGEDAEVLVASLARMSHDSERRREERRLAVLAVLARRKFQAVRLAADLISIAVAVAGTGLLITYVSC